MICFFTVCRGRNNKFARAYQIESRRPKVCWSQQFFTSAKMVSVYFANTMLINSARSSVLPLKHEFKVFSLPWRKFIKKEQHI